MNKGKTIGTTRSGKPVFENIKHPSHENYTTEDHRDAAAFTHHELMSAGKHTKETPRQINKIYEHSQSALKLAHGKDSAKDGVTFSSEVNDQIKSSKRDAAEHVRKWHGDMNKSDGVHKIQVVNPNTSVAELNDEHGIPAKKVGDEIHVGHEHSHKLKSWMNKRGWSNKDIKETYPELHQRAGNLNKSNTQIIEDGLDQDASTIRNKELNDAHKNGDVALTKSFSDQELAEVLGITLEEAKKILKEE